MGVAPVVERLRLRVDRRPVGQPDRGVARLGDAREPAGADLGQQGHAEGGALGRVERVDVVAVDVGLDLPPEGVPGAAAGEADLADRDAHLADQFQAVAHRVGRPFEHAADQVRRGRGGRSGRPSRPWRRGRSAGCARRSGRAGRTAPRRPGRRGRPRRSGGNRGRRPGPSAASTSALPSWLRNHWKLPPAESTTPMTCQAPGTAWQPRWSRPSGSKPSSSAWAKTTPEVPIVAETTPGRTIPLPTAPAGWSPPPPTTGVPDRQAGRLAPRAR